MSSNHNIMNSASKNTYNLCEKNETFSAEGELSVGYGLDVQEHTMVSS